MPELWLALGAGLLSSLHCVGMCGPVVAGWQSSSSTPVQIELSGGAPAVTLGIQRSLVLPQVLYHAGRVVSYGTIGMIAGALGSAAMISAGIQQVFTITFGALMIASALFQMDAFPLRKKKVSGGKIFSAVRSIASSRPVESRFLIGLFTPFLPCGLLYGMALHSAATHSPILGALEMSVFALGAAPALFVVATLSHTFSTTLRKYGSLFAAVFILIMGVLTILRGAGIYHDPFASHQEPVCTSANAQVLEHH